MDANGGTSFANKPPGISLVLVCAGDPEFMGQICGDAAQAIAKLTDDFEILVVTGSATNGGGTIPAYAAANSAVKFVSVPPQAGYGAALRCGLQAATRPLVGYLDAGGQFDVAQLERLLLFAREYDIVSGYRLELQGSWRHRVLEALFNFLGWLLLGTAVRDGNCPFKLLRRDVLKQLPLEADGRLIHVEILSQARLQGFAIGEVGVWERPCKAGANLQSLAAEFAGLLALVRYWWSVVSFPAPALDEAAPSPFLPRYGLLLLLLIAAPILLLNLSYPLLEPDENRNAQIALEMFQSGDYVVPTRNGQPYLYKPPLLFWMISGSYGLFGVHEWAARLPVALCALTTIIMTYVLGQRVAGPRAAWIGAALLLLTCGFVLAGRFLLMDVPLTMFTSAALLLTYRGMVGERGRAMWWLAGGLACGLGILLKGPVALVLVVPPIVVATWVDCKTFSVRWREWAMLVGLALAVALPWYLLVTCRHPEFPQTFLWTQNLQRYTTGIDHEEPWWYFGPVLLIGMFPASCLLPALAAFLGSRDGAMRCARTPGLGFLALAAGWVVLFFSLSSSKLPTYILPALPALCLLLGRLVDQVLLAEPGRLRIQFSLRLQRLMDRLPGLAVMVLGVLVIGGVALDVALDRDGWLEASFSGLAVAFSMMLLIIAIRRGIPATATGWSLAGGAALVAVALGFNDLYPEIAADRSHLLAVGGEVEATRKLARENDIPVAVYGTLSEGMMFYMDDRGLRKFSKDQYAELIALAKRDPRLYILSTHSNAVAIQHALPSPFELVRTPGKQYVYELVDRRSQAQRSFAQGPAPKSR